MRIPHSLRDLQVERESLFLDFSSQHSRKIYPNKHPQQISDWAEPARTTADESPLFKPCLCGVCELGRTNLEG